MESALKAFDGTILFVSHDRYFIEALAGKIFEIEDGKIDEYDCSYSEYSEKKRAQKAAAVAEQKSVQHVPAPTKTEEKPVYRSKEERKNDAKRRTRIKEIETEIEKLEEENELLSEEISTPEVAGSFALLTEKCNRMSEIKERLDALYEEYETLL